MFVCIFIEYIDVFMKENKYDVLFKKFIKKLY